MAESYKKEARIEINAVFDDESLVKKLAETVKDVEKSADGMESNLSDNLSEAQDSVDDFKGSIDDSITKLDEEQYKVDSTGNEFENLKDAKESAENANLNFGDSAEESSKDLDKETKSVDKTRVSLTRLADEANVVNDNLREVSDDVEIDIDSKKAKNGLIHVGELAKDFGRIRREELKDKIHAPDVKSSRALRQVEHFSNEVRNTLFHGQDSAFPIGQDEPITFNRRFLLDDDFSANISDKLKHPFAAMENRAETAKRKIRRMNFSPDIALKSKEPFAGMEDNLERVQRKISRLNFSPDADLGLENAFAGMEDDLERVRRKIEIQGESYSSLLRKAETVSDVYKAQTNSLDVLSDATGKQRIEAFQQSEAYEKLRRNGANLMPMYKQLANNQEILKNVSGATKKEVYGEAESLESLVEGGESAAEMKDKVSRANKKMGGITEEQAKKVGVEGDALQFLASSGMMASQASDEVSDSSRSLSRTLSAANESVDETGDSLRAAAEIGDIFEDGLGSLSVNLGAFTIALRNFLTQIPLLITALGAAAEAAAGAASAFIAVAGAIAGAIGAGVIARARQLKEEYSQIENLGESIQVIFQNVKDTFLEAAEPALNRESIELFRRSVEGTASVVNMLAQMVEVLMQSGEDYSLQDAFDDLGSEVLPEVERVVNALIYSFRTLGEETISVLGIITGALADLIVKSTDFVARIEDLGEFVAQFRDTVSALSELGLAVGSGLIPVFSAFSSVMEGLASTLNQVDDEILGNVVTYTAAVVAFSKLSGVVSTFVTILPNLALGFSSVATEVGKADSAFKAFQATAVGTNARIANFLSQISAFTGITALIGSLGGMNERFRQIAFRTSSATARFEALALGTNVTAQQLYELAVAGDLSREMMEGLQEEAEDVDEDFRKLQLRLALTEEQFKSLDDGVDFDLDEFDAALEDPTENLDVQEGGLISRFIGDAAGPISDAKDEIAGEFIAGDLDMDLLPEGAAGDSIEDLKDNIGLATLAQYDLANASETVRGKISNFDLSSKSLTGTIKSLSKSLVSAWKATFTYAASLVKTIGLSLIELARTRSLSSAYKVLRNSKIGVAIATFVANSALLSYIATAIGSTIATYGLIKALTILTGGAFLLVAAIGALAVGLITNFEKIKSAGSGALSPLMSLFGAIKDILLTTFVETWNIIVSAVTSLITIFSPLINVVKDFMGIFGLLSGEADNGSSSFSIFGAIVNIIVSELKRLSAVIQLVFGIIGVLGKGIMLLIVTPAKIAIGVIRGLAEILSGPFQDAMSSDFAQQFIKGFKNVISVIKQINKAFIELPHTFEDAVNAMIKHINNFIDYMNNEVPVLNHILNIGEVSEVELTGGGLETDREELARDTAQAKEGIQEVASNTINMRTENNQTVNQTVNADPEDKSTVSRVVEDAIERANRFDKTRSGI